MSRLGLGGRYVRTSMLRSETVALRVRSDWEKVPLRKSKFEKKTPRGVVEKSADAIFAFQGKLAMPWSVARCALPANSSRPELVHPAGISMRPFDATAQPCPLR